MCSKIHTLSHVTCSLDSAFLLKVGYLETSSYNLKRTPGLSPPFKASPPKHVSSMLVSALSPPSSLEDSGNVQWGHGNGARRWPGRYKWIHPSREKNYPQEKGCNRPLRLSLYDASPHPQEMLKSQNEMPIGHRTFSVYQHANSVIVYKQ